MLDVLKMDLISANINQPLLDVLKMDLISANINQPLY